MRQKKAIYLAIWLQKRLEKQRVFFILVDFSRFFGKYRE
jgi:hypothetical protein